MSGKYIVIEGHDGTGKSTQVEKLANYLKQTYNIDSFIAHEPAGTPIADSIRNIIKNGELERDGKTNILLFTAARHEIWRTAEQALKDGKWVISARNFLSTIAYQGYGENIDIDLIYETTRNFTSEHYMNPDKTFILTTDDQTRKNRIANRGELEKPDTFESRDDDFQQRINDGYLKIISEYNFKSIDASRTIDEIHKDIIDELKNDNLFNT